MNITDHVVVGFSGNRRLDEPDKVYEAIRELLAGLPGLLGQGDRKLSSYRWVALSSAAMGADLLFVRAARTLKWEWINVLPFPAAAFLNSQDFPNQKELDQAREYIEEANDREVIAVPHSVEEGRQSAWRHAAFTEGGFRCVDGADIFLAVLQETPGGGKPGGTSDVVEYARQRKRPLILLDPSTFEVRRENWPPNLGDPMTADLAGLPLVPLTEDDRKQCSTQAAVEVAEWRNSFAAAARRHVPSLRRRSSAIVVLHALATIITALVFFLLEPASLPGKVQDEAGAGSWSVTGLEVLAFLLVATGFCFLVWLQRRHAHDRAASARLGAEIGRSLLAVWTIPGIAPVVLQTVPRTFRHLTRNLLLCWSLDPERPRLVAGNNPSQDEVDRYASEYSTARIDPQIRFYRDRRQDAKRNASLLEKMSFLFSLAALVCSAWLAFAHPHGLLRSWLGFLKVCAATSAPVVVSLLIIHEVKRRESRYHEMMHFLQEYRDLIQKTRSFPRLRHLIVDSERVLLGETFEWWILVKNNMGV